jgi:hypothetical protein
MQLNEDFVAGALVHSVTTTGLVRVAWIDEGHRVNCIAGRCIDASNKRLHVQVSYAIPLRTPVAIRAGGMVSSRSAQVKYVTTNGTKFILALDWE